MTLVEFFILMSSVSCFLLIIARVYSPAILLYPHSITPTLRYSILRAFHHPTLPIFLLSILSSVFCILSSSLIGTVEARNIPFSPGEKLTFQVRWAFIPAGEGTVEIHPMESVNGTKSYHFSFTARTFEYVDVFYKVRDRLDAYVDESMSRSLLFKKHQDGRRKRRITVSFDWETNQAQYADAGESRKPISILPGSFDPLSVFYAFRLFPLREGVELQLPVTDGKKCVVGRVKVVKRETIEVRDKVYETFLVEPILENLGGVFEKTKDAKLKIWVTADGTSVPVRIESELIVGSFVAELVSAEAHPAAP